MILEFKNVSGTNKGFNLKNVSFQLEEGYIMGIIGKNGAGKTTLLNYITRSELSYSGEILYKGINIKEIGQDLFNHIGIVSDDNALFPRCTVRENAALLSCFYSDWNQERFMEALKELECPTDRVVMRMSRGEKLKLQMALAIGHNAKLFLLDEATSGMDPVFRKEFYHMLHNMMESEDRSVIMTNHNMEEITLHMDFMARMDKGQLMEYKEALD